MKKDKNSTNFNPYQIDKFSKIPLSVKVIFIKFWVVGAFYFFLGFGLLGSLHFLDKLVVLGLALGLTIDFIMNKMIRWLDTPENPVDKYQFIKSNGVLSIFLNIIYGLVIVFIIMYTYEFINISIINIRNINKDSVPFPVEPIGFSLFFLGYDYLFLTMKLLIKKLKGGKKNEV